MVPLSLALIEDAIRSSWSDGSCDPVDVPAWTGENPALGQCGATALVVQDLLGGELLGTPAVVVRPPDLTGARLAREYECLRAAVADRIQSMCGPDAGVLPGSAR